MTPAPAGTVAGTYGLADVAQYCAGDVRGQRCDVDSEHGDAGGKHAGGLVGYRRVSRLRWVLMGVSVVKWVRYSPVST